MGREADESMEGLSTSTKDLWECSWDAVGKKATPPENKLCSCTPVRVEKACISGCHDLGAA